MLLVPWPHAAHWQDWWTLEKKRNIVFIPIERLRNLVRSLCATRLSYVCSLTSM